MSQELDSHREAYIYAFTGNIAFAFLQILFKQAAQTLTIFEVLYIRSIFLFFITYGIIRKKGLTIYVAHRQIFKQIVVRIILVGGGQTLVYYCLGYLPVSTVTTLYNLGPIFIFFIEAVAYKKKLKLVSLVLTVISFSGVLFIVQPEFLFGSHESIQVENFQLYVMLMILTAFTSALNYHYIHGLSKTINPIVNMLYSHFGYVITCGILCNFNPFKASSQQITFSFVCILIALIIVGFSAQYAIFMANSLIKPSKTMPLGYLTVAVGFVADVYLFGTRFTFFPIIGILLTSAGLLTDLLVNRQQDKENIQFLNRKKIENEAESIDEFIRDSRA